MAGGPGRIPAQMIGLILYYFSDQGALVFDPMAGGGVVPDTCLALNRKCRSFDMESRLGVRPEIEPHFWNINDLKWPIKGKTKPDLIIFDPPAIAYGLMIPESSFSTGKPIFHLAEGLGTGGQVPPISRRNRKIITRKPSPA